MNVWRRQARRNRPSVEQTSLDSATSVVGLPRDVELTVVSNRGPIECRIDDDDGGINHVRGAGGVAAALSYVSTFAPITWVFSAMTNGDVRIARAYDSLTPARLKKLGFLGNRLKPQFFFLPFSVYHKYYEEFSNRILWFLQHYMWNSSYEPNIDGTVYDAWREGYVAANELFAAKILDVVSNSTRTPVILIQDYHLYLAPEMVRRQAPDVVIEHFTHIPWPESRYWELLPLEMREAIFRGLAAADVLGFQTRRDARNFIDGCLAFLPDARIDRGEIGLVIGDHLTRVRAYPISVDPEQLHRRVKSASVRGYIEKLQPLCGEKTIVRVDRLEPSKNIVRGLRAFDELFAEFPEYIGRLKLLLFLVPSRERISEYRHYRRETIQTVDRINQKYGHGDWRPIEMMYENNYDQALAGLTLYDVLLVNPLIDGMNLVAKEGPIVNSRDGVLVLSEGAGAYQQLKDSVVAVAAADIEGTKRALRRALEMPAFEKNRLAAKLRHSIEEEDLHHWFTAQLEDLADVVAKSRPVELTAKIA